MSARLEKDKSGTIHAVLPRHNVSHPDLEKSQTLATAMGGLQNGRAQIIGQEKIRQGGFKTRRERDASP
jgi:hypothetical protein